jgi:peroxiredoxin
MLSRVSLLILGACALVTAPAAAAPQPAAQAPSFTGQTADGRTVSLADYAGKTVVLEWTNHDCPFVKKHYESGNMQSLQKDLTGKGVAWLTVISSAPGKQGHLEPAAAVAKTADVGAAPSAVILDEDGSIGRAYGATATPHMFVITPQQTVAYMGAIDSIPSAKPADIAKAENYVRLAYDAVAAGQPVGTAQTKAYGCSVKYQ